MAFLWILVALQVTGDRTDRIVAFCSVFLTKFHSNTVVLVKFRSYEISLRAEGRAVERAAPGALPRTRRPGPEPSTGERLVPP